MVTVAAFAVAAAVGSLLRFAAQRRWIGRRLPVGTLAVNLTGSFVLGTVAAWAPPTVTVIGTAGLGALTTFSTFADEVVALWDRDRAAAWAYLSLSLFGGVALAWTGLRVAG